MVKIRLDDSDLRKLRVDLQRVTDPIRKRLAVALLRGAVAMRDLAVRSIQKGRKTGRIYDWRGAAPGEEADSFLTIDGRVVPIVMRARPHRASAPGEAPATDTGRLVGSIRFIVRPSESRAEVGVFATSGIDYAEFLEFGTRKIAPRPYLGPAAVEVEPQFARLVDRAVNMALRERRL